LFKATYEGDEVGNMLHSTSRSGSDSTSGSAPDNASGGASGDAAAGPALHRAQEMLLAAVADGGTARLAHICLDAWNGSDPVAAGMTLGSLLRAVPGMDPITAHEFLAHLHATERTLVGDLDHSQRLALPVTLARARGPRRGAAAG
jgi:hypothetical protein